MLCLQLLPGEYLTIGDNVVLQYDSTSGERCKLVINAPREIPILRGAVLERSGKPRPDCVYEKTHWVKRTVPWDRSRAQALSAMRKLLAEMDGNDRKVKALRRQLNHMFPPPSDSSEKEELTSVSSGCANRLK